MFIIKIGELQDIPGIYSCIKRNLPIYYTYVELYHMFLTGCKIIIIKTSDQVIGVLIGYINPDNFYIASLSIDEEYRRLNLATQVINNLTYKKIYLHVKADNYVAINFYNKNNFHAIKFIKDYYGYFNDFQVRDAYLLEKLN